MSASLWCSQQTSDIPIDLFAMQQDTGKSAILHCAKVHLSCHVVIIHKFHENKANKFVDDLSGDCVKLS